MLGYMAKGKLRLQIELSLLIAEFEMRFSWISQVSQYHRKHPYNRERQNKCKCQSDVKGEGCDQPSLT